MDINMKSLIGLCGQDRTSIKFFGEDSKIRSYSTINLI
jgi:hypothetical protein